MSIQIGTSRLPPLEASASVWVRVRRTIQVALREPNPILVRELRQSARLTRTPVILAVITSMVTLLIASIGGLMSANTEPAEVGIGVFHTFFSLAFAVVTWVGPAVAAATIASERSGRTWEALQLTTLAPQQIARGKFFAALTYVLMYVVMLAPVGALSLLFGGVTPTEVVLAFLLLGLISALAVAFGLAMSSKLASPAISVLVTLLLAVPLSIITYLSGGVALSFAVHQLWSGIPGGPPVWLPTAYVRADFSADYWVFLVLCPLVAIAVPAWLFYETTIANMTMPSDDRSTRLRTWLISSSLLLTATSGLASLVRSRVDWFIASLSSCWVFFLFAAFLVAGEPLGPSRRVQIHWQRTGRSSLLRWLGPGVSKATTTTAVLAVVCLAGLTATGLKIATTREERLMLLSFGGFALGFSLFTLGFAGFARARAAGAAVPRIVLAGVLFAAIVGPNIALALSGVISSGNTRLFLVAAPSPTFAFFLLNRVSLAGTDADLFLLGGAAAAIGWGLLGIGLLLAASLSVKARLRAERKAYDLAIQPPESAA